MSIDETSKMTGLEVTYSNRDKITPALIRYANISQSPTSRVLQKTSREMAFVSLLESRLMPRVTTSMSSVMVSTDFGSIEDL